MANKQSSTPEVTDAETQQTETLEVKNTLANPPSQSGQNGYEYTHEDDDVSNPNRRDGLGE